MPSSPPLPCPAVVRTFTLAAILVLAFHGEALGQTAHVSGRITDATSAVLPGAVVTVTNTATGTSREATANERGFYTVPFMPPGTYSITARMAGFQPAIRDELVLSVDEAAGIDFTLEIGALRETVQVADTASLAHREDPSIGQVIGQPTIVDLPLNGRNYTQLIFLSPGAVPNPGARLRSEGGNLNGNRTLQNRFLIDGLDNNNYLFGAGGGSAQAIRPSVDAIQEFKVETANYGAQHGSAAGGVVSVVIKSGANTFRGSAFEFFRDESLESNDFFAERGGLDKPPLRYNQFGGTLGGPIVHDRAFFFASYQGTRELRTYTATVTVPTPEMVRGVFGDVPIYDPLNVVNGARQPFPDNTIPPERMDPVGQRIAQLFPPPNRPGAVDNFVGTVPRSDDRDQIDARVDYQINARSHVFARYSRSTQAVEQGSLFGPPGNGNPNVAALGSFSQLPLVVSNAASSLVIGQTQVLSAAVVNEFRAGYSANRADQRSPATRSLVDEFGIKGIPPEPNLTGLPFFDIAGFAALGDRSLSPYRPNARVVQVSDSLSWAHGPHVLKVGGEIRLRENAVENLLQGRGEFTFTGQFTSQTPGQITGSGLADLLLGQTSVARLSTPISGEFRDHYYAAYVSDAWKVAPGVALNLGLRYEVQTPMWELRNRMASFDADPRSATFGTLVPARDGDLRARTFSDVDQDNIAPRLGVTWQVNPKTALRAAYGLFYGGLGYQAATSSGLANVPYFVRVAVRSASTSQRSSLVLADGFRADALEPGKVLSPDAIAVAPELPLGQVHQWHLGIERQLGWSTAVTMAYVGSASSHLPGFISVNAPVPGPSPVQARRPFPAFGEITQASNFVEASYHSLQASVERRVAHGLALLSSYTWSHAIDNSNDGADTAASTPPQNPNDIGAEKASALFDVRHRFTASIIWESPVGQDSVARGRSRAARWLLGGWRLAGIFVAQSGYPLTPTILPNSSISTTPLRPDCLGDGNLSRSERTIDRWFDLTAFHTPAPFTFGNCGRNVLRGPGFVNLDLLVGRDFRVSGDKRIGLRLEVFNVANAVHLGPPNTVIDEPEQAGRITSTQAPPRQAQLGLRFDF